jgi:methionine-rich copper-binding protein CopC
MRTLYQPAALAIVLCGIAVHLPSGAHANLLSAVPGPNAILASSPARLTLGFSEAVEQDFTTVKVLTAQGLNVLATKPVKVADARAIEASLPPLPPGRYRVEWSSLGSDGHRADGSYAFTVR